MLQHILIMALFTLFVGGIQLLLRIKKNQPVNNEEALSTEEPIRKAV